MFSPVGQLFKLNIVLSVNPFIVCPLLIQYSVTETYRLSLAGMNSCAVRKPLPNSGKGERINSFFNYFTANN